MGKEEIIKKVMEAGIVGAGGGGFPTHVKISASVTNLIANGAECEPLLSTDRHLMVSNAKEIIAGLRLVKQTTGAKNVTIALKKKYSDAIEALTKAIGKTGDVDLHLLENFYPAGDEQELVFDITGKAVGEGGIPLDVDTVVINVNTLLNINGAVTDNKPVITRWVTVGGEVNEPYIAEVPIGITAGELIDKAGPTLKDYKVLVGGPMMGRVADRSHKITKLCGGVIVLEEDHSVIVKQNTAIKVHKRRGSSICDQCFDCTIVCPRNLLGHELEPHKIMRNLFIAEGNSEVHLTNALLCSECGLCNMFACPLDLAPRELLRDTKKRLTKDGVKNPHRRTEIKPHPERDYRRVNTDKLIARINMRKYDIHDLPVKGVGSKKVVIALKQHAGAPAEAKVKKGSKVKKGDHIASIPAKSLGANIHASISGEIAGISKEYIEIKG